MFIWQLNKDIFPPIQDILGICYQITFLILYNINSRFVTFLKFIYASLQISNVIVFIVTFLLINIAFQILHFLFLNFLLFSRFTFCSLSLLIWFGFCKHCSLTSFRWSVNFERLS